jgi:hypothetical protein
LFFSQNQLLGGKIKRFFHPAFAGPKKQVFFPPKKMLDGKNKCYRRPANFWPKKQVFFSQTTFLDNIEALQTHKKHFFLQKL